MAFAIWLGGLAPEGHAASLFWNSTLDGTFSDTGNWSPSQAPAAGDSTFFTNSASYTVTFTANALDMNSNYFSGKAGTVTLDLGAFTWGLTNGSALAGRGAFVVGQVAGSTATVYLARGSLVVTNAAGTARLVVGGNGIGSFFITNGAVRANATSVGDNTGSRGTLVVSGTGVIYTNTSTLKLGASSSGNSLTVSNSAALQVGGALTVGSSSSAGNSMLINDAALQVGGIFTMGSSSANNSMLIAGSNALVTLAAAGAFVGSSGANNSLTISNGGQLTQSGADMKIGFNPGASNNTVTVVDLGSVLNVGANSVYVGGDAAGSSVMSNVLFVSKGGQVLAGKVQAGTTTGGSNSVVITSGGLVQVAANGLAASSAAGNTISNDGGIFQFTVVNPTVTPNGYGRITLNNGTISFRGIATANVQGSMGGSTVTNILFSGANTFRLNNASNTSPSPASSQNYTFGYTAANPSNYAGLEMINAGTAWKSAWLAISNNGSMLISNTSASIQGVLSNSGTIRVVNATATFASNVVLDAGSYTFAGATNTFASGLTISSGALFGGSGRVVHNGVTNAGTLAPGNSPGTMTFSSNLTLLGTSKLVLEIGTNGLDYDHLIVEGTLTKGGTVLVTNLGWTLAVGNTFNFWDATLTNGSFLSTNLWILPDLADGLMWDTTQFEGFGIMRVIAIPEPSATLAVGAGLALLAFLRARSRKA
jgi:T5SS/PEP-CTERM-associated repeat protein